MLLKNGLLASAPEVEVGCEARRASDEECLAQSLDHSLLDHRVRGRSRHRLLEQCCCNKFYNHLEHHDCHLEHHVIEK